MVAEAPAVISESTAIRLRSEMGYYEYDANDYEILGESAVTDFLSLSAESGSSGSTLPADRKIIRDANITMEVEDVEAAYAGILARLSGLGGYEAHRNMHTNSNYYHGGRLVYDPVVTATLKIPAGNLDIFLDGLKNAGEIIVSNISSSDITEQYFDAQIKLTTLEKTLENYYRFLEEAKDIDEQLRITRFINDTTREIEQLKGSLRRWDSLVDYSTVTLELYRPYEAPVEPRVINWDSLSLEDIGWYISSGFLSVVNAIFSVIIWTLISIAVISPILIPVAILVVILVIRHKKKKRQKKMIQDSQINQSNTTIQ